MLDEIWIADCCLMQTKKDRTEANKIYEGEEDARIEYELLEYGHKDELSVLKPEDLWRVKHETECAWFEFLHQTSL